MKVLIDFTQIPLKRTGAGIYAENIVREIIKIIEPEDQVYILLQRDEYVIQRLLQGAERAHAVVLPFLFFRNRFLLMIFEQLILPFILRFNRIDVVHSLHYTSPLWPHAAQVVTFHDLTMILWPSLHTRARRTIMPLYMRAAWKKANAILFVSSATQKDAERIFPASNNKREVTPLGVEKTFFISPALAQIKSVLDEFSLVYPYFVYVGTLEPRKNVVNLIKAFERIALEDESCELVIAGKLGWGYKSILDAIEVSPFKSRIRLLGYVSEDKKKALLSKSIALVYPSHYEGFGLPILEAMALGVPVITSKTSSMPEVAGDAALLIDPSSIQEIAHAMKQLLVDPCLSNDYKSRGPARASLYSWSSTAATTYRVYKEVCMSVTNR